MFQLFATRGHTLSLFAGAAVVSWGALSGCSTGTTAACPDYDDRVVSGVDDDADFSAYQTFAIRELTDADVGAGGDGGGIPADAKLNLEAANEAAAAELTALGLDEVDPDQETPDLWVFSATATEVEQGVSWTCVPDYYWTGVEYYFDPCAWMDPLEFQYTVGTLVVGVADAETELPVFGGLLQGPADCPAADLESRIEAGVATIFEDYPSQD
jgi:hypothetical protein